MFIEEPHVFLLLFPSHFVQALKEPENGAPWKKKDEEEGRKEKERRRRRRKLSLCSKTGFLLLLEDFEVSGCYF